MVVLGYLQFNPGLEAEDPSDVQSEDPQWPKAPSSAPSLTALTRRHVSTCTTR